MKMFYHVALFSLMTLAYISTLCNAYTAGPPVTYNAKLCQDMDPTGHRSSAQGSTSPYSITMNSNCYMSGSSVSVTITASNSKVIGGFFLEARDNTSTTQSYGTFGTGTESGVKLLDCFGGSNNAIGHSLLGSVKTRTFMWTPPAKAHMEVHFRATFVHKRTEYWIGVVSNSLSPCGASTISSSTAASSRATSSTATSSKATSSTATSSKATSATATTTTVSSNITTSENGSSKQMVVLSSSLILVLTVVLETVL